jgi:general secretion pathway protein I
MVAVAILGVALTAIFASEAGAIRVAARARFTTTATLLARCKMAEVEEEVMRTGLPAVSAHGTDECCEEGEVEGFECEWEISRIVLPEAPTLDDPAADPAAGALGAAGAAAGAGTELGGPPAVDQIMSGAALAGGGTDMVAELALQFAFPILKPQIEDQVRRATVTVRWHEGEEERSFDVVQYVIAEQPPAAVTQAAADAAQQALSGGASPPTPPTPQPRGP